MSSRKKGVGALSRKRIVYSSGAVIPTVSNPCTALPSSTSVVNASAPSTYQRM